MFKFRDITIENGWEGYSPVGIGINDVASHGSCVLIVSEMEDSKDVQGMKFMEYVYSSIE